ncbi:MAG: ATP-dependent Clp protease adapter ClpS [Bdellovibrionales bacterium CG10_big_fil_rev_8_21_14_0_10_45_34]|nr:MAG: ATP-dependent Clp protease adapter ClpS [Bdellovibrionales bacterium CG10_big_fil_rev_8_21_14_0_10_45_34]
MSSDDSDEKRHSGGVITKPSIKVEKPRMYKVVLLNDDYTPMDFVVVVLKAIFRHDDSEAVQIMLEVHNKGAGVAGVFPYDIAEMKASRVHELARKEEHPLKCLLERE